MLPFELTKDTPYLALSGELWSVFYEYFNRNWSCYKGFLLYNVCSDWMLTQSSLCVQMDKDPDVRLEAIFVVGEQMPERVSGSTL